MLGGAMVSVCGEDVLTVTLCWKQPEVAPGQTVNCHTVPVGAMLALAGSDTEAVPVVLKAPF